MRLPVYPFKANVNREFYIFDTYLKNVVRLHGMFGWCRMIEKITGGSVDSGPYFIDSKGEICTYQ